MLRYVKYQSNSTMPSAKGKWYLRLKSSEMVTVEDLAAHMSMHNTPYSQGTISGVITDMVTCIKELLLDGNTVKLSDLAIFSLGINSTGADTPEEAVPANITSVTFNARGTGKLNAVSRKTAARFKEQEIYDIYSNRAGGTDCETIEE